MSFCKKCGKELPENAEFCPACGEKINVSAEENTASASQTSKKNTDPNVSDKSRAVAALLAFFVGGLGIHHFYCGKKNLGITMLVIFIAGSLIAIGPVITSIWALIDFIMIICGTFRDEDGKLVLDWNM